MASAPGFGRLRARRRLFLKRPMSERIRIVEGDITKEQVDAIVNAANSSLMGGGGVDGAIHRAAGPGLLEECWKLRDQGGCPTGEARITGGHKLPARHVIHTVGPVWQGGDHGEDELLASCYRSSLELAKENRIRTIAFPAISTGIYGFPLDRACRIAVREVRDFLSKNPLPIEVRFVCFDVEARQAYEELMRDS